MAVDYFDFVQAHGVLFVPDADDTALLSQDDAGPVQFTVRCSLIALNEATHVHPPPPRDGDASVLAAGTKIYALNGWPTTCRLLAHSSGSWRVYEATGEGGPLACSALPGAVVRTAQNSESTAYPGCHVKTLPPGQTSAQMDYVAFIDYDHRDYVDGLPGGRDPGHGAVVMHVSCEYGPFSDSLVGTNQSPVQGDGDAAFLPVGTPVYSIKGSPLQCRLTAKESDGWHVYTADGPGCPSPAPIATALPSAHD